MENKWIVVLVQRGIAVKVKTYKSYESAERAKVLLMKKINLEDDDVSIFKLT